MKKNLLISIWYTLVTTVLLGIGYPLVVTGFAQVLFPKQANGELIQQGGKLVGSHLIGQPFTHAGIFLFAAFGGRERRATILLRPRLEPGTDE